jgi:hypothetical protein
MTMDSRLESSIGDLLAKIGPVGIIALMIFVWVKLDKKIRKAVRAKIWTWIKWALRQTWYLLAVAWWATRNGIPYRLALRLQPDRWNAMVDKRQLPGLKRGKIKRSPIGVSVRLTLTGKLTSRWVSSKLGQLETGLGLKHGTSRIKNVGRADLLVLEIRLRDPIEGSIPWERPSRKVRLADPVRLSLTEFGDPVSVSLKNRIGIFGESGSGKSCVQRVLGAHVIEAVDAGLEVWDLKQGVESQHYAGKAHRVTTIPDALARLDWLVDEEFPRRALIMKERGVSQWKETADDPALVVIVDEGNVITRDFKPAQMERFYTAVEQGRAMGVYFVWATQYPKAENLPTQIRSQLNITICLRLRTAVESRVVFDSDDVAKGWAPHTLPPIGWCLVMTNPKDLPVESKAVWLSTDEFRDLSLVGKIPGQKTSPAGPAEEDDEPPASEVSSVAGEIWSVLLLSDHPMGVSELARQTGRSKAGVHQALKKLAATGAVKKVGMNYMVPTMEEKNDEDQP